METYTGLPFRYTAMNQPTSLHLAAVVLNALPKQQASRVLQQLNAPQRRSIFQASREIGSRPAESTVEQTLAALESATRELRRLDEAGIEASPSFALPPSAGPFDFLKNGSPEAVGELLAEEHPKHIAIVLNALPADLGSEILETMDAALRISILKRLCEDEVATADSIENLAAALRTRWQLKNEQTEYNQKGLETAAKVLSCTDSGDARCDDSVPVAVGPRIGQDPQRINLRFCRPGQTGRRPYPSHPQTYGHVALGPRPSARAAVHPDGSTLQYG